MEKPNGRADYGDCNMDIQLINDNLLSVLHWKARESERRRMHLDLRTDGRTGHPRNGC